MRSINDMKGININGKMINILRYADDTALVADNEKDIQRLLDIVFEESEKIGLSLNVRKTETMVNIRKEVIPTCKVVLNGIVLKHVVRFKYFGSIITSDGRCEELIKARIGQA